MIVQDLRKKSASDLQALLMSKKAELMELQHRSHQGQLKNGRLLSAVRRDIAQIFTVIRQLAN